MVQCFVPLHSSGRLVENRREAVGDRNWVWNAFATIIVNIAIGLGQLRVRVVSGKLIILGNVHHDLGPVPA